MKTPNCVLLGLLIACNIHAQVNVGSYVNPSVQLPVNITDTITLAQHATWTKDFELADQLLTQYNNDHVDINALRLHAQLLYWMKAFDRSTALYEKAVVLFPNPSPLNLDYARVLFNLGKMSKARSQLKIYRQVDSTNVEVDIMNAYLDLWHGKIGTAKKEANKLLQQYPTNAEAKDIINTINNWTVPYLKAGSQFAADDQPLKSNNYYVEGGAYKSWLFAPTAQVAMYHFNANDSSYHSLWVQFANTMQFTTTTKLKLKGGIFQQNGSSSSMTGSAEISQQIAHNYSLQVLYDHRPYQYSISSVRNVVMEDLTGISFNYNRNNKWFGKVGYDSYGYKDANKVHVVYLWMLAPIYSSSHFSFSGGYAFRYADALNSTFTSKESMSDVINNWPPVNGIQGIYEPYFTPEGQISHSALASVNVMPSKKVHFASRLNIAFAAKADNPYLYVDTHDSGLFFNHGFAQVSYTPITWVNELSIAASNKFSIGANYMYNKLLYYKGHQASLELKYLFAK